jgi:Putative esterase
VGRFDELETESQLLRDNPLGDPHVRPLWVYMPPAYAAEPDRRFPSIYLIQGMTGQLDMWRNRSAFRPSTPERIDRLFAEEGCPAAVIVFVDAWTSYGGSQFIDSPGTGRYGEYVCDEVVSFVDARYRTLADAAHRGLTGKSSGGYGAMVVPMLRPDVFGGLATHAGDALFELCYLRDFPEVVRVLRETSTTARSTASGRTSAHARRSRSSPTIRFSTPGGWPRATRRTRTARSTCRSTRRPGSCATTCGSAGSVGSGAHARHHADALRSLRAIYIDAGKKDEFFLDLGADAFRRELEELGITDVFFELFDAGHGGIEYRYPLAIRYLAERLQ